MGIVAGMALGLRELGHDVTTMVSFIPRWTPDAQYDIVRGYELLSRYDYTRSSSRFVQAIGERIDRNLVDPLVSALSTREYLAHDLFLILYRAWLPEATLYPLIKRLGKKIAVYYCGSEVRHFTAFDQEFGNGVARWTKGDRQDDLDAKVQRLRLGELYADAIFSVGDQSGLQIRPYYHSLLPADPVRSHTPFIPARARPILVHAPTRPELKGTAEISAAIETLRREGHDFEYRLLKGVTRTAVLTELESADIVIDQLALHGPGMFGAEAMALGCAVATRALAPVTIFDPPVCRIEPDTLVDRLRQLVLDVPYRVSLAEAGAAWVRAAFDPKRVASRMLDAVYGRIDVDYHPRFFLERFRWPHDRKLSRRAQSLNTTVARRFAPESLDGLVARGLARS